MATSSTIKNFALIGLAGYVAPRHLRAIRDTGHRLVAALDKHDNAGILDSYFPAADFFTEFERFDRHLEKLRRAGQAIDYLIVCSPNYLHDAHIRFGLRIGANVVCEKPLVLNPWNVDALRDIEMETGRKIYTILQLRLHPAIIELQKRIAAAPPHTVHDVDLTYITARGSWYYASWKGDPEKSGGIATNIGIHFFDMLTWVFGAVQENIVHVHTHDRAAGYLHLDKARVRWFLSINADTLPDEAKARGARTFRSITVDGSEIEFSEGFTDLHTLSYQSILAGQGFGLSDAATSIQMVQQIREMQPAGLQGAYHPLAALPLVPHPFRSGSVKS
ncbi:MAG TPA: Gfo/Idh/MocA family oxidoreductase [Saprospiraceae bacterium]|nr:Gfo/Idh/MocA family oxidoreductase [Saprospiraceae bacterium]